MKFEIRGKNIELTDALKDYTTRRLSKLEKYLEEVKEGRSPFPWREKVTK